MSNKRVIEVFPIFWDVQHCCRERQANTSAVELKKLNILNILIDNIKCFRADPYNMTGEIRVTVPWSYLTMEYDTTGHVLIVPIKNKGFFRGNFSKYLSVPRRRVRIVESKQCKEVR